MNRKYVFLDIDGTLLHRSVGVPDTAVRAIREARKQGHRIFICTGRSRNDVPDVVTSIDFDGYICAAGASVEVGNTVLFLESLEAKTVEWLMNLINHDDVGCFLEGYKDTYANALGINYMRAMTEKDEIAVKTGLKSISGYGRVPDVRDYFNGSGSVSKVSLLTKRVENLESLKTYLSEELKLTIHDPDETGVVLGEITKNSISKASGIRTILDYFNADRKQTIGYGDSMNDLEMVRFCRIGVCMENGSPTLKELADDVAAPVINDGIYKSFIKYGLIQS